MSDKIPFNDSLLIENRIFNIRGLPVMLDSDLAKLYQVETKVLNQAVKRNGERFPNWMMFHITMDEWVASRSQFVTMKPEQEILRSQIVTSSQQYGGRRYLPFAFTEQGVAMLSAVLKSEIAIKISLEIIQAFVTLRRSGIQLSGFQQRLELIERKQIDNDSKFDAIFHALEKADPIPKQGIFFNGQIFDAYIFASDLIKKATKSIILVDNYVDETTLALLSKSNKNVEATIYSEKFNPTFKNDLLKFNQQYTPINFCVLKNNHDRFLIIDRKELYHIGASLKDLGKKLFAFSRMDAELDRLLKEVEKT
jgi:hypothetical protein